MSAQRIAIFASGKGSNARNIIHYFNARSESPARVVLIVCNKPDAGVLKIADQEQISTLLIDKEQFFRGDAYIAELRLFHVDLLVLAGFLWKIPRKLIDEFPRRIINIHPALLPKYGGKGFYGNHVHESVINSGDRESGITIHYVDEHYDHGDIIFQARVEIGEGETPETLAAKIHQLEYASYPKVIEKLLEHPEERRIQ